MASALESSEPDWAWLPKHLLDLALEKLKSRSDRARFGAVCKEWYLAFANHQKCGRLNRHSAEIPMLLVPSTDRNKNERRVYSVTKESLIDSPIFIPYNRRCCGSSYGWLIYVTDYKFLILYNPFTTAKICLPRLPLTCKHPTGKYQYSIDKAILSADPTMESDSYTVVAIYFRQIYYIRSGEGSWNQLQEAADILGDILFYRGRLIVATHFGGLFSLDMAENRLENLLPNGTWYHDLIYIEESSLTGDLYLVYRFFVNPPGNTTVELTTDSFTVFKVVFDEMGRVLKSIRMRSLGEETLFLGDNHSLSISCLDFPGLQKNRIYFTDNYMCFKLYWIDGPHDLGMFSFTDRTVRPHYQKLKHFFPSTETLLLNRCLL